MPDLVWHFSQTLWPKHTSLGKLSDFVSQFCQTMFRRNTSLAKGPELSLALLLENFAKNSGIVAVAGLQPDFPSQTKARHQPD